MPFNIFFTIDFLVILWIVGVLVSVDCLLIAVTMIGFPCTYIFQSIFCTKSNSALKSAVMCCSSSRNNLFQTLLRRFIFAIAESSPLKRTSVGQELITGYPAISISFLRIDSSPAAQLMAKFIVY